MSSESVALQVDASGLRCPMPLLKAKQGLGKLRVGEILELIATDPGSKRDFKAFTSLTPHELIQTKQSGETFIYRIRKGSLPKT